MTPETPLPPLPIALPAHGLLAIRPIATAGELRAEGQQMNHCVAHRLPEVLAGHSCIVKADYAGERLTVELRLANGEAWLGEVRGAGNEEASAEAMRALRKWVAGGVPELP